MYDKISYNLTQPEIWNRFFFMLVFAAIGEIIRLLIWVVTIFQIASVIITGKANENILHFGRNLSVYAYHILLYLTFSTEKLPFPFTPWNLTAELQLPENEE
jgi:hypothetical protein